MDTRQTVVTLSKPIAVRVTAVPAATPCNEPMSQVVEVKSFTGRFVARNTRNGKAEVTYRVTAVHFPVAYIVITPVDVDLQSSLIVASQEVEGRS